MRAAWAGVVPGLLLGLVAGCRAIDSLAPVTPQGLSISRLFIATLGLSAVIFVLVVGLLVYILIRFRGRPGEPDPPPVHGNTRLEVAWTIIPALVLVVLFILTLRTMSAVDAGAPSALRIKVIGHQWWWEYQYPDLGLVTANELHLPVGAPVRLEVEGADVIHSFWVPQLGWKKDAIPGKTNDMWVQFGQVGTYDGACTEYCGIQHAWMRVRMVAESREKFDAWVEQERRPAAPPATATARRGQDIFMGNTCVNCHAVRGTAATARVAPDLTRVGSRSTLGAGVVANTRENLRRWIRQAQAVKPGVLMPDYGNLSDDDLAALVEYLAGLT
jgi:cytochrome c oxidase subunit II